jgi:hypothetical protein
MRIVKLRFFPISWTEMPGGPLSSANITKLISATACHMIAPLILFNHKIAFLALPVMKIVQEKLELLFIAITLMGLEKAIFAEGVLTDLTNHMLFVILLEKSFTMLLRAEPELGILRGEIKQMNFFVLILDV